MEKRELGFDEIEEIVKFDKLCFPNDAWSREDWEDLLTDERAKYTAIMDNEKIVGDIFTYDWSGEKDYLKIMHLAIHQDHRKEGLAGELMEQTIKEFKSTKLNKICAETRASNIAMQRCFDKYGFIHNDTEKECYQNPSEDGFKYIFEK